MAPSVFVLTAFDYNLLFLITLKVSKEKWIYINEDGLICLANYIASTASCSCYIFLDGSLLFIFGIFVIRFLDIFAKIAIKIC